MWLAPATSTPHGVTWFPNLADAIGLTPLRVLGGIGALALLTGRARRIFAAVSICLLASWYHATAQPVWSAPLLGWVLTTFVVARSPPRWIYAGTWLVLLLATSFDPADELLFAPRTWSPLAVAHFALLLGLASRGARPWAYGGIALLFLIRVIPGTSAVDSVGVALFFLAAWNPSWLRGKHASGAETFYYDGACGLCHRGVQLVATELETRSTMLFAPLAGPWFQSQGLDGAKLPDSVVFRDEHERVLVRSDAALAIAQRMGGLWRAIAALTSAIPRPLRDWVYNKIARIRLRLFARPDSVCPMLPPDARARFRD